MTPSYRPRAGTLTSLTSKTYFGIGSVDSIRLNTPAAVASAGLGVVSADHDDYGAPPKRAAQRLPAPPNPIHSPGSPRLNQPSAGYLASRRACLRRSHILLSG